MRFYNRVDGLKTGYIEEAGYCLTATIKKDNMRLIAVAMGEPTSSIRNSEVSALLDYGYNLFQSDVYLTKDTILDNVKVEKGVKVGAVTINEDGNTIGTVDVNS